MVEENLEGLENRWRKRKSCCNNIFYFGFGAFIGVITSVEELKLPNTWTGASIAFYLSVSLMVGSILCRFCLYAVKKRKIKNRLKGIFHS